MTNCECKRMVKPHGTWTLEELIGARVKISSMPVTNFAGGGFDTETPCTIKDIYFRVSLDGKTITIIELEEFPGYFFTWKDLEIEAILVKPKKDGE